MFKVALRMAWSDIRTTFSGWGMWVFLALMAFLLGALPIIGDSESSWWASCAYAICLAVCWFSPRFTRAFHVVPFTIKEIKKLVIYRCVIFVSEVMLFGGVFLALSILFSWDWNPGFGLWYFFFAEFYFVMTKERLAGFHVKKYKVNIWLGIWTAVVMGVSALVMLGIAADLPLYVQYLIQTGIFLLYLPYPMTVFKSMDFYDFRQVKGVYNARPEFLE